MSINDVAHRAIRTGEEEIETLPDVSIIILNFNGRTHLEICLPSLQALDYPKDRVEIIVVDNASADDSVSWMRQKYPEIRLLANSSNLGFAGGIYSGVAIARGRYVALLNADMRVDKDWLSALVKTIRTDEDVACAGSIVLNWTGDQIDYAGRPNDAFCLCPDVPAKAQDILKSAQDGPMLFASGGAMLIDREIFLGLGGFDCDYFLYNEDVDLGWRLWLRGYKVLFCAKSIVYHRGGASSKKLSPEFVQCMAQRYVLYTMLKNLEDAHLWQMMLGVLWFLVERSLWFDAARLSLGEAIRELSCEMETVLSKRAAVQSNRVRSDSEIFASCGNPIGFLRSNKKYLKFERYLAENREMFSTPDFDPSSISQHIIQILIKAYNDVNIDSNFLPPAAAISDRNKLLLTTVEEFGRRFTPPACRNYVRPLWRQIKKRFTSPCEHPKHEEIFNGSVLSSLKYIGNRRDRFGKVPHLIGSCNICGDVTAFFCNDSGDYRESLKCASCLTTSRYRSIASGILRAVTDLAGIEAKSIADFALKDGNVPLKIYDTQVPFYTKTDAYPIPDLLSRCKWLDVHKSIYQPNGQLGSRIAQDITNQNLECLTFADNTFDIVITSDVMEHVRLDDCAHREICRVLKPGGIYIFTVPHNRARKETLIRVQVTDPDDPSKDLYLMEPEYHGDANSQDGAALSYRTYGTILDDKLREMGFAVDYLNRDYPEKGIMKSELFYCRLSK